jgi:hypothetical protein
MPPPVAIGAASALTALVEILAIRSSWSLPTGGDDTRSEDPR